jgi:hypothetical protein
VHYNPRGPEQRALRQILAENLSKTRSELAEEDVYLPRFVWRELEAIIDCGVVDKGFVRVVCGACKHERIVGFSCKGRAVCSSCVGRKMNELSLHLFDHVVPDVPLRQFVLTLPVPLRILVARDKRLLSAVRTVFLRAVKGFICKKARDAYPSKVFLPAGFCVVQRFGSALQLAPHLHAVLFDGAYREDEAGKLHFVAAPALTPAERLTLVTRIASRVERLLERRGLREPSDDGALQLELLAMKVPASLPVIDAAPDASAVRGFNLHTSTRISALDERGRLRLFRYVLRPAIAQDRLRYDGGVVTFQMKRVFSDGTSVLHFTPQSFIRRIAMLVPAPRQHEITYTGLLAANAKHRNDIVRVPTHRRIARVDGNAAAGAASKATHGPEAPRAPSSTMPWAELLKRTFAFDVLHCEHCGGRARVVAAITNRPVVEKILAHLRNKERQSPAAPRAPPATFARQQTSLL